MPRPSPPRHARGRNRIARRWRCLARLIPSSRIPASTPRRWSESPVSRSRTPPRCGRTGLRHAGPSPSRTECARCCRWPPPWRGLAPPRPADVIFPGWRRGPPARPQLTTDPPWVLLMGRRRRLRDAAAANAWAGSTGRNPGFAPRHGLPVGGGAFSFTAPGSDGAFEVE